MKTAIYSRLRALDNGRDPERLAIRYAAMRGDPFVFLRGSCQLFCETLPVRQLPESPLAWCCGDLHLQNFGTFKGDNRLTYFDLNDFDEACLAPAAWDLVRFLTSVLVAADLLGAAGQPAAEAFLDGYAEALAVGKARWIERATATGEIRALLSRLKKRNRRQFLNSRTKLVKGSRRLITGQGQALPLEPSRVKELASFVETLDPGFFHVLDAARRVAGTGSLGLERYVLLVEGRGSPDGNFLLDLKYEPGSSAVAAGKLGEQPRWASEAERVVVTQHDMQAASPALLRAVKWRGRPFVLHELLPSNDRLDLRKWPEDASAFVASIRTMGEITAWGQLRASARRGACDAEELMAFGRRKAWRSPLLRVAGMAAEINKRQWQEFSQASQASR
ncbi:MAG: DUF2252 domain-containing protein [Bryobacteraceae bacterium]|nr:DUF2252 domain-containing protein [Bryobacteraceae bacterium]